MNIQRTFVNRGKPLRDLEFLPGTFINRGITLRDTAMVGYGRRRESQSIAGLFRVSSRRHGSVIPPYSCLGTYACSGRALTNAYISNIVRVTLTIGFGVISIF